MFYGHIVSFLTSLLIEQDWPIDKVPVAECAELLESLFPAQLVKACLYTLCEPETAMGLLRACVDGSIDVRHPCDRVHSDDVICIDIAVLTCTQLYRFKFCQTLILLACFD